MNQHSYEQFTLSLHERLAADERVLGLVALGSMADPSRRDEWSDHDFWVITQPGAEKHFLNDLSWLPNAHDIILPFRQGTHYYTVLYRNSDSVEFAVFDREQMQQAKTNRYAILLDKAQIADDIQRLYEQTITALRAEQQAIPDHSLLNYFFLQILAGVQRYLRGEMLSGQHAIYCLAVDNLLVLIKRYVPAKHPVMADGFDSRRYFERSYPRIAGDINTCLRQASPPAAMGLLVIAEEYLASVIPDYPYELAGITRDSINTLIGASAGSAG